MSAFHETAKLLLGHVRLFDLKWRQHGLGMLQAEITEALRIHIWHPKLRTMPISDFSPGSSFREIHDHRFDLTSTVIVGEIIDVPFWVEDIGGSSPYADSDSAATSGPHIDKSCGWRKTKCWEIQHAKVQIEQGTTGDKPAATDYKFLSNVAVALRESQEYWPRYKAGAAYRIPRRQFHTTRVNDLAITVVHRENFDDRLARVLGSEEEASKSGIIIDDTPEIKTLWAWAIREAGRALALADIV